MRAVHRTTVIAGVAILAVVALGLRTAEAGDPSPEDLVASYARAGVALTNADAAMLQAQAAWMQTVANIGKITAETMMICEETQDKALDNDVKTAQTYFGRQERREQYLAQHPRVRPDADTYRRICSGSKPAKLVSCQLDKGTIFWPELLQGPEFDQYRQELDILFAARQGPPQLDSQFDQLQFQLKVANLTRQMQDELKDKVHETGQMEYIAARKFLAGLAYNARLGGPQPEGLVKK